MKRTNKKYSYPDFARWLVTGKTNDSETPQNENVSTETLKEFEHCTRTWEIIKHMQQIESFDTDKAWEKLTQRFHEDHLIEEKSSEIKKVSYNNFLKMAAAILILLGISTLWIFLKDNSVPVFVTNTQKQALKYILPDNSLVYLNKDAQLSFTSDFNLKERKLTLSGEAFFEVTPNPEKPFIVEGKRSSIKVLGTSFNVSSENQKMEVIVATGKVEVFENQINGNKLVLLPGDVGIYNQGNLHKTINQTTNFKSWVDHKLVFKAVPLAEALADVNKAYHCQIIIGDSSLNNLLITTTYDDISLSEIVSSLTLALNINYKQEGNQFILINR